MNYKIKKSLKAKILAKSVILVFALNLNCFPKVNPVEYSKIDLKSLVTFAIGNVTCNGKAVVLGKFNEGDQEFKIMKNSLMDLQIENFDSSISLRSKKNSSFVLYARNVNGKKQLNIFLSKGDVLVSVSKLKKDEEVIVFSPTMKSKVVGTQFKVIVKDDASTNLVVGKGKVQVKNSNPTLEALYFSQDVDEKTKVTLKKFMGEGSILEENSEVTLKKTNLKETLKDPELIELLNNPVLKNVKIPTELPEDKDLKNELAVLEKSLIKSQENLKVPDQYEVKKVDASEINKEAGQIIILTAFSNKSDEEIKKELNQSIKMKSPELLNTMSKVMGKGVETLILKNGNSVSGIIYQSGSGYVVKTPYGNLNYTDSQVSGLRF